MLLDLFLERHRVEIFDIDDGAISFVQNHIPDAILNLIVFGLQQILCDFPRGKNTAPDNAACCNALENCSLEILDLKITGFDSEEDNFATATQTLIVQDTTDPKITMPANIVRQTSTLSGLEISFEVTATDAVGVQSIDCVETSTNAAIDPAGYLFPVGPTVVTCTATDTSGNPQVAGNSTATGEFTVTVEFQYSSSGISGKSSGKTGSSFPLAWAWTDDSGTPQTVSEQMLSIEPGGCPADGNEAQDPGQSGLRQNTDGTYNYNLQAIDPSTQEPWVIVEKSGDPFCFTVSLPTGESESKGLTIRR